MQKGQISTETLALIGVILLLMIPFILYAIGKSNTAKEDFAVQKAEFAAQRLARLADSIGYLGGSSAIVEQIDVPPYVKSVRIGGGGHDIIFEMDTSSGKKQIVRTTPFNITADGFDKIKKEGTYYIQIRALSNFSGGAQIKMSVQ
ncbi:MAG: hypothetical protein QXN37_01385 [Candidatus Anstonellaceae archaeon]